MLVVHKDFVPIKSVLLMLYKTLLAKKNEFRSNPFTAGIISNYIDTLKSAAKSGSPSTLRFDLILIIRDLYYTFDYMISQMMNDALVLFFKEKYDLKFYWSL